GGRRERLGLGRRRLVGFGLVGFGLVVGGSGGRLGREPDRGRGLILPRPVGGLVLVLGFGITQTGEDRPRARDEILAVAPGRHTVMTEGRRQAFLPRSTWNPQPRVRTDVPRGTLS